MTSQPVERADGNAPPPFTAEQIRDATAPGRTYVYRIQSAQAPPVIVRMAFVSVTLEGATIRHTTTSESGERLGEPEDSWSTWDGLVGHALWPASVTTIGDAEVEVPAGRFDAVQYTIVTDREGHRGVTQAWFARTLPGAPMRLVVEEDGRLVRDMTLLEHLPGKR